MPDETTGTNTVAPPAPAPPTALKLSTRERDVRDKVVLMNAALERRDADAIAAKFFKHAKRLTSANQMVEMPVKPDDPTELTEWEDQLFAMFGGDLDIINTQVYGNVVLVIGAVNVKDAQGNATDTTRGHFLVFQRRGGNFLIVFHSASGG